MDSLAALDMRTLSEQDALSAAPLIPGLGRSQDEILTLRLRRTTWEAEGVLSLELVDPNGADLPRFDPGAHVDLHLPTDLVRQYSLCGDPSDRKIYRIAVREIEGGRASRVVHHDLRPGDLLQVGSPRNNFVLADAARYIFVAGGIGVTPLLPMARAAGARQVEWTLHYCCRRREPAFIDELRRLGGEVFVHDSEGGNRFDAMRLVDPVDDAFVYCCGPQRLMTAVGEACAAWPPGRVRFEWFQPRAREGDVDDSAFEVVCGRSGRSVTVTKDSSVLQALLDAGLDLPFSCEQGVCGTCEVRVLEGEVDHRDSILSAAEQAAHRSMMACVSRARGRRLVLDV